MCGVMIGYPGDPDTLVDPLPQRERQPRTRKPLSELCFSGRFGQAYDGLPDETR
jgi:hypothetical protein